MLPTMRMRIERPRDKRGDTPIIAAIYARKSTEQAAVAEDAKAVTRQVQHARALRHPQGLDCRRPDWSWWTMV